MPKENDCRPAIVFPRLDPSESFEGREYWSRHWWEIQHVSDENTNSATDNKSVDVNTHDADGLVAISYDTLIQTARGCASQIRALLDKLSSNGKHGNCQPIVGLAIPEGPLLPLSVLTLHMIQLRYYNTTDTLNRVPIILPLDPDEPAHRLCQILE